MGRLVVILLRSGASRLDAVFLSVHGISQKLAIYCHYRGTGYNFPPIVFASALHRLSDSVGTEFSNKKTLFPALTTMTKPDKLARLGMFPCLSRRTEGRGCSKDFPLKSSFTFPFLSSLYAQHTWASETARCLGGSYSRDLTNFSGHYFLAFVNRHWVWVWAGTGKRDGIVFFPLKSSMGCSLLECCFLLYVSTSTTLSRLSFFYTTIIFVYIFQHHSLEIKIYAYATWARVR